MNKLIHLFKKKRGDNFTIYNNFFNDGYCGLYSLNFDPLTLYKQHPNFSPKC